MLVRCEITNDSLIQNTLQQTGANKHFPVLLILSGSLNRPLNASRIIHAI